MDKILEIIAAYWETFKLFQIVDPYESGVQLRFGHYLRTLTEGVWWKLPVIDSFIVVNTALTTMSLPTQTIGNQVVSAIVRYRVTKPKKYLLTLWDAEDVVQDVTMGVIRSVIDSDNTLSAAAAEALIKPEARKGVRNYGIRIYDVTFVDFGKVKSLRIIMDNMGD